MSVKARQIVELTAIKPFGTKCVLLHIADTVRDGEHEFFRSHSESARRLGTRPDVVRRHLSALLADGILTVTGEMAVNGGIVTRYRLEIPALLELECIRGSDCRPELLAKSTSGGGVGSTGGEVLTTAGVGPENTTNLSTTNITEDSAEKESDCIKKEKCTREFDPAEHLKGDADFEAFVAKQQARRD